MEEHEILECILVHAVICVHAVLELDAEGVEEPFVRLPVGTHHLFELALYLLFDSLCHSAELSVVLEHLA